MKKLSIFLECRQLNSPQDEKAVDDLRRWSGAPVVVYNLSKNEQLADLDLAEDALRAAREMESPPPEIEIDDSNG